jgi:hypothetical protein
MKDLISIDDININQIDEVHRLANQYFLNPHQHYDDLKEKILLNFFFENSTRTRMSFEIAGKKMGAKKWEPNLVPPLIQEKSKWGPKRAPENMTGAKQKYAQRC